MDNGGLQNITDQANAAAAVSALRSAIATLGTVQGNIGAAMNRLQDAVSESQSMYVAPSESRIRDANIAAEAADLTKFDILNQSGLAALAQANQNSSSDLAAQLDRLYTFINSKILKGSTQLQIARLEEAIKLLTILLAGWEEAAKKEDLAVPTTLLAGQAANTGRFRLQT